MALHDETLNENVVLDVVEHARRVLERGDEEVRGDACALLGIGTDEWASCRAELLGTGTSAMYCPPSRNLRAI